MTDEPDDPHADRRTRRGHVIVTGAREVGTRVVEQLVAAGESVVVADDDPDPRWLRRCAEVGADVLSADARRPATLQDAGVAGAAAVVCVDDSDLENLEVVLLARRLRPDVRVVVQLGNEAVARAVEGIGPGVRVLDVAAIAAPGLAEACLARDSRPLPVAGEQFVLREVTAPSDGTLRALYGDLVPVAVVPADGTPLQVCPGRDLVVTGGDRVALLGPVGEFVALGLEDADPVQAERSRRRRAVVRRYVRGLLASTESQLTWTLRLLLLLAVVSVVVLRLAYRGPDGGHMSVLDAVYFTTETLTTVGFGDFNFAHQPTALRVWAVALMIIGAIVVTLVYAMITNLLVSRRIAQSLGRQVATRMTGHVVVVGLGSVGLRVVEELLAAGESVAVLDRDEDNRFLARARALGVPVVFGDATVTASLDAVGLVHARAVAVLTSNDLANIETGLAVADRLGDRRDEVPIVLRVFDRALAEGIAGEFGFHAVRSTAALAAPWFVGAALGLEVLTTFYVDTQPMLFGRLTVGDSGGLSGRPMVELSARIRVVALSRRSAPGTVEHPPRRDTRFAGGDRAWLVGPYEELLAVLRRDRLHDGPGPAADHPAAVTRPEPRREG